MADYFISDTHFGHGNIIGYCNRPFHTSKEMDGAMIAAWNSIVQPGDTVWHLGDFCMDREPAKIDHWLYCLNGTKHLIRGNHDHVSGVTGWASVQEMADIHRDGHRIILFHYPLRDWPGKWKGGLHLYGHVHGNMEPLAGSMDMGVDTWGGKPVTLDAILRAMQKFHRTEAKTTPWHFVVESWGLNGKRHG